ncbi:MAG: phosphoribosylanthranilate isomerase [Prevotellaceae bacterium]|jgi:phosphoribosylanthranilate isomerase|nr:phosphoribosylanthranilate isomerase [Prevotellaceae bacterium]
MSSLKVKVCGMRDAQNINEVAALQPDYMGFIFYEKSPRYALRNPDFSHSMLNFSFSAVEKVAVFVNESEEKMREIANKYGITTLQLHGNETPAQCSILRKDFTVIKAFSISEAQDFEAAQPYSGCCDFFLFDTKTQQHGGSGAKFDWLLLENYRGTTPFFLSGGIDLSDAVAIAQLAHPQLWAVDINSRFELTAGAKNVEKVKQFIEKLNYHEQN